MTQYIAFEPQVEVLGAAIMSVSAGLGERATPILQKYNLYPVEREQWYKQQDWLDAFREFSTRSMLDLLAIGMKIPDEAEWPPDVKSVHDALASIDIAYHMNHRNGEIGHYSYRKLNENEGIMVCNNPYPSDFDLGIVYGTAAKFSSNPASVRVTLDHREPSRKHGAESCTYLIKWSE